MTSTENTQPDNPSLSSCGGVHFFAKHICSDVEACVRRSGWMSVCRGQRKDSTTCQSSSSTRLSSGRLSSLSSTRKPPDYVFCPAEFVAQTSVRLLCSFNGDFNTVDYVLNTSIELTRNLRTTQYSNIRTPNTRLYIRSLLRRHHHRGGRRR